MLSLYHHTSSPWNHTTACKAHEKGNPLSAFEPHSCSTMLDIPVALHSVPPPIRLHIVSLSLSSLVVIYKKIAAICQRMPQCHIHVLIYL